MSSLVKATECTAIAPPSALLRYPAVVHLEFIVKVQLDPMPDKAGFCDGNSVSGG